MVPITDYRLPSLLTQEQSWSAESKRSWAIPLPCKHQGPVSASFQPHHRSSARDKLIGSVNLGSILLAMWLHERLIPLLSFDDPRPLFFLPEHLLTSAIDSIKFFIHLFRPVSMASSMLLGFASLAPLLLVALASGACN